MTISGRNLSASADVKCVFENVTVPAASVDAARGVVVCPIPPSQKEGTVNVTLLDDGGVPFLWSFQYYGTVSVTE